MVRPLFTPNSNDSCQYRLYLSDAGQYRRVNYSQWFLDWTSLPFEHSDQFIWFDIDDVFDRLQLHHVYHHPRESNLTHRYARSVPAVWINSRLTLQWLSSWAAEIPDDFPVDYWFAFNQYCLYRLLCRRGDSIGRRDLVVEEFPSEFMHLEGYPSIIPNARQTERRPATEISSLGLIGSVGQYVSRSKATRVKIVGREEIVSLHCSI